MASRSNFEVSEVLNEILASDWELSGDEEIPDTDVPNHRKNSGNNESENNCSINFVCKNKDAMIRNDPCFRNNMLDVNDELNEGNCTLLYVSQNYWRAKSPVLSKIKHSVIAIINVIIFTALRNRMIRIPFV